MMRLLSPNEAKFWLLDQVAPTNSVVVLQRAAGGFPTEAPPGFDLPVARLGRRARPRWTEPTRPGVLARITLDSEADWVGVAEDLLDARIGTDDNPPWQAVVADHPGGQTLLLAVSHALTDYRTALAIGHAFAEGTLVGDLAPACEELLPDRIFADEEAGALIEGWWSDRAGARWEALGLQRLTAILPPASRTRLMLHRYDEGETARILERCEAEGASLNSALAIALRDAAGTDACAFSVDLSRFIRPALPPGPGMAISHVYADLAPGDFWEAARDNRAVVFDRIEGGEAGDSLLILPRLLQRPGTPPAWRRSGLTITGAPTWRAAGEDGYDLQLVLSAARAGGGVVIPTLWRGQLQLLGCSPEDDIAMPLAALAAALLRACD
jgi:hypothetical protein